MSTVVALSTFHPRPQGLGMNAELGTDPLKRPSPCHRILPGINGRPRRARSRNSSGYFLCAAMNQSSRVINVSIKPGAVRLVPARGFGPGFRSVLEDFERRTGDIKLRDSTLLIDNEKVIFRAGSFDFISVAEVVISDRVATLIGPDGFLQEPMTSAALSEY